MPYPLSLGADQRTIAHLCNFLCLVIAVYETLASPFEGLVDNILITLKIGVCATMLMGHLTITNNQVSVFKRYVFMLIGNFGFDMMLSAVAIKQQLDLCLVQCNSQEAQTKYFWTLIALLFEFYCVLTLYKYLVTIDQKEETREMPQMVEDPHILTIITLPPYEHPPTYDEN